jgi:hypothetical protein
MRIPLQSPGFSLDESRHLLDLRYNAEVRDTLYLVTLQAAGEGFANPILHFLDEHDDGPAVTFGATDPYQVVVNRFPVRGPIALSTRRSVDEGDDAAFVGYVTLEGPDYPTFMQPISPVVLPEGTTSNIVLTRIETQANLTLFVHLADQENACRLRFVPDDEAVRLPRPLRVVGPDLTSDVLDTGFIKVLDRMPVVGPGTIYVDHETTAPMQIYGFLSD